MLLRDSLAVLLSSIFLLPLALILPKIGSMLALSLATLMALILLMTLTTLSTMPMMLSMAAIPILKASLMLICG